MPITVLADVIVPTSLINTGVRGKQIRKNTRTTSGAGYSSINVDWSKTLRQYEFGFIPLLPADWQTIEGLHEVTEGGAYGMLLQDPKDSTVAVTEGLLQATNGAVLLGTMGVGFGVPTYKLHKRYTAAGSTRTKDRAISRPMAAGIVLKRGAATLVQGTGAGQVALDATTGTITFVADASQAISSIGVGATTQLNFVNGTGMVAAMAVAERVYITGVTGTAGAALNGLSHQITAKGATSITISTVTTGLAVTLPGTALRHPQASEALTWAGSFYVPVHFASDEIDWELVRSGPADTRLMAGPSVTLQEVRESGA